MTTTVTCFLMGGLGNQLFQIFATIAYSYKYNCKFVLPYSEVLNIGISRITYWDTFLSSLKKYTTYNKNNGYNNNNFQIFPQYREPGHQYTEIPKFPNIREVMLFGYFQSYHYFENERKQIFDLIKITETKRKIKEMYSHYFKENEIVISMHFRLGDYKYKQDYHPIMPFEYYRDSLEKILISIHLTESITVLYFCEEEDNDTVSTMISQLSEEFFALSFVKVDDKIDDWMQLMIMSNCHHNIIANSSFSWWGAYFNENKNKIVCYPSVWFGPAAIKNDIRTMFPNYWKRISINTKN